MFGTCHPATAAQAKHRLSEMEDLDCAVRLHAERALELASKVPDVCDFSVTHAARSSGLNSRRTKSTPALTKTAGSTSGSLTSAVAANVVHKIANCVDDQDPNVKIDAMKAMALMPRIDLATAPIPVWEVANSVFSLISDGFPPVRKQAALTLGRMAEAAGVHLIRHLRDEHVEIRRHSAEALASLGGIASPLVNALGAALGEDTDAEVRALCAKAFYGIGSDAPHAVSKHHRHLLKERQKEGEHQEQFWCNRALDAVLMQRQGAAGQPGTRHSSRLLSKQLEHGRPAHTQNARLRVAAQGVLDRLSKMVYK